MDDAILAAVAVRVAKQRIWLASIFCSGARTSFPPLDSAARRHPYSPVSVAAPPLPQPAWQPPDGIRWPRGEERRAVVLRLEQTERARLQRPESAGVAHRRAHKSTCHKRQLTNCCMEATGLCVVGVCAVDTKESRALCLSLCVCNQSWRRAARGHPARRRRLACCGGGRQRREAGVQRLQVGQPCHLRHRRRHPRRYHCRPRWCRHRQRQRPAARASRLLPRPHAPPIRPPPLPPLPNRRPLQASPSLRPRLWWA